MIPTLLWRCPLCETNDALVHLPRRFRRDLVQCRHCSAEWRVRRALGDDYYLEPVQSSEVVGQERPLREWYSDMKRTVGLVPIEAPEVSLQAGEMAYLVSGPVDLTAEANDPLFFPAPDSPAVVHLEKSKVRGVVVGRGTLVLTNQRLIWQGNGHTCSFSLENINSAHTLLDYGVAFMAGMRLYIASFLEESVLKWITYLSLVAHQVEAETGHRIATSHF